MTSKQPLQGQLPEFNLFNVLEIWQRERQHSEILAWLLDPYCSHGLYENFLRVFLEHITGEAREREITVPPACTVRNWKLRNTEVEREQRGIDILLVNRVSSFVCLIENKVFSNEHSNQLSRYLKHVKECYRGFCIIPVFLTREGDRPAKPSDASQYISCSYYQVANLLNQTLKQHRPDMASDVYSFIEQYNSSIRQYLLPGLEFLSKPIEILNSENHYIGVRGESRQRKLNEVLLRRKKWRSGKDLVLELKKAGNDFTEPWIARHLHWYRKWKRVNF